MHAFTPIVDVVTWIRQGFPPPPHPAAQAIDRWSGPPGRDAPDTGPPAADREASPDTPIDTGALPVEAGSPLGTGHAAPADGGPPPNSRSARSAARQAWLTVGGGLAGLGGLVGIAWCHWFALIIAFGTGGAALGLVGRLVLVRLGIGCRAPACEISGAGLAAVVGWRVVDGLPWAWAPVPLVLGALAVPLAAADLICRRLPDALTLAGYPLLGLAVVLADPHATLRALAGLVVFGGAHLVVRAVAPAALGGGDVKLAGGLGIVLGALGWVDLALAATLAAVGTLVVAMVQRSRAAPHGPGLLAATWVLATLH